MRMIKVGDKYLGLVDNQAEAIRFVNGDRLDIVRAAGALADAGLIECRVVKLTTLADRTADSMRGLADDVNGGGDQS